MSLYVARTFRQQKSIIAMDSRLPRAFARLSALELKVATGAQTGAADLLYCIDVFVS